MMPTTTPCISTQGPTTFLSGLKDWLNIGHREHICSMEHRHLTDHLCTCGRRWGQRATDPLIAESTIADGPYVFDSSALIRYACSLGSNLAYGHRYVNEAGDSLWVLVPSDEEVGTGQENYIETLAEQVCQRDEAVTALFIVWPFGEKGHTERSREFYPRVLQITFSVVEIGGKHSTGRTLILGASENEVPEVLSDTSRQVESRFQDPGFRPMAPEQVRAELRSTLELLTMTYQEIAQEIAQRHPEWPQVRAEVRQSLDDGLAAQEAIFREWSEG